jgi:cyclin-C
VSSTGDVRGQRADDVSTSVVGGPVDYPYQIKHILECEFYLLEIMDCCLIVYHPYRSLDMYTREFQIDQALFEEAWRIINDSLKTDAPLLYPPYEIALACLLLAATKRDKMLLLKQYMIDAQIDVERIYDVVKLLLKYYELMSTYDADPPNNDGKQMKELLAKIPKPKVAANGSSRPSSQPNEQQLQMAMQQQAANGQQNNNTGNL